MKRGLVVVLVGSVIGGFYGLFNLFTRYPLEEILSFGFIVLAVVLLCFFTVAVIQVNRGSA